jgi:hypothetical protein
MGGRGEDAVVIRMLDFVALGSSSGGQQLGEVRGRGRPGWAGLGRNAAGTWAGYESFQGKMVWGDKLHWAELKTGCRKKTFKISKAFGFK